MNRFACSISTCHYTSLSLRRLIHHLEKGHVINYHEKLTCGLENCVTKVKNIRALKQHVKNFHGHLLGKETTDHPILNITSLSDQSDGVPSNQSDNDDIDNSNGNIRNEDIPEINVTNVVAKFLLESREHYNVSSAACQFISQTANQLLNIELGRKYESVKMLMDNDSSESERRLQNVFHNTPLSRAYIKFSADKSLNRYISQQPNFVSPVEYILQNAENGLKKESFQYIPLLKTLDKLLKHDDVLNQIFHNGESGNGQINSFHDSDHFKNHPLFNSRKNSLMINLYDDEFVVSNPIGNKTSKYKLLAFYFTLGNFRPQCNSKVDAIQLVSLVKSIHAKKHGIEKVLAPLMHDLGVLENKGITISFKGTELQFFGSIFLVISDNLAAHWLAGFQESFSKTKRVCRFCLCTRADMKSIFHHSYTSTRTKLSFEKHLESAQQNPGMIKEYGIKQDCVLNNLKYFHCANGFPFDSAHDFLEGVIPHILTEVIKKLVTFNFFSLREINEKINHFHYCRCDKSDLPQPMNISSLNNFKVKLDAAECWNFFRLFPLSNVWSIGSS